MLRSEGLQPGPQSGFACVLSCSVISDSRPHGLQPTRLLCPWDSPGKNAGVGCYFLLQEIFPTQGSNPGLPHCRQILHQLSTREASASSWGLASAPSLLSCGSGETRTAMTADARLLCWALLLCFLHMFTESPRYPRLWCAPPAPHHPDEHVRRVTVTFSGIL